MTDEDLHHLALRWIAHMCLPEKSTDKIQSSEAFDEVYDLAYDDPESLWKLILEIHRLDRTPKIDQVLSAGPIESLLAQHGEQFIERVEAEAQRDPTFALTLGGVWKNQMSDSVWGRLQAVWDRRGWG